MSSPIQILERAFQIILAEARSNDRFAVHLAEALNQPGPRRMTGMSQPHRGQSVGRRHRRPPGSVNPIEVIARGEPALRTALAGLDLEQLKDIVAEHGMDTRKLAMKWKDRARVEDLIVTFATERLAKGSVFRTSS